MTGEELDKFIDNLPDIDTYKRPGGRCYAFSYAGGNKYDVLLDDGTLVDCSICVKHGTQSEEYFKSLVKLNLKGRQTDITFIGLGIVHRY